MWIYVHQHKVLLVLGLINIGGWSFASASMSPSSPTSPSSSERGATTRKVYDINYRYIHRQLAPVPVPTTSSYNYWWPYPPQTAAAPPAALTTTSTTPALLLSFDAPSTQSVSPTMSSSTFNSSSSTSTSTSMTSMIIITPRPPQTTSPIPSIKSLPKNDPKAQFKVVYVLAPLFALLGVILGSVAAWLVYGCLTRKPRVRQTFGVEEKGIGGPRYMPAGNDDAGALGRDIDVENGRYTGLGLGPIMQEVDMETDEGMALFRWPGVSGGRGKDVGVHGHGEDDPFLIPPSTQHKAKARSSKSMRSVMSNATSLAFLELYESDEEALDDERREKTKKKGREEDVPWESLRHKSIKRGILERVRKEAGWVDSLRGVVGSSFSQLAGDTNAADTGAKNGNAKKRHAHVRGDSDLRIEDLLSADGVSVPDNARVRAESKRGDSTGNGRAGSPSKSATRPLLPTFDSAITATTIATTKGTMTASRANSSRTTYSTTSDGNGFRILAESPLPHPPPLHSRKSHTSQSTTSGDSSYWWWGEASVDIDRYTAVPARICRSRSQSRSRSTSPVKRSPLKGSECGGGRNVAQWPSARDILPQSPPRIMSPMLEDQLCFTPKPGHGRSVDVATPTTPWGWGSVGVGVGVGEVPTPTPMPRSGGAGKDGKGKEKGRRLRSPRPPSLPFPRDPDRGLLNSPRPAEDVFRGRLVKQQSSSPSRKLNGLSRDKTLPGRPVPVPMTLSDGVDVDVDKALTKVGEIVKQSWSTRELQLGEEGMRSLSPMGFGRRV